MKIVIGNYGSATDSRNLILNDEVKVGNEKKMFTLVSKIEGIETAPFRNGTGDWSGADGGYISSQLFSARTITISGTYIDRSAGCDYSTQISTPFDHLARLYIRSRLPIRTKQYIRIFLYSGMTFYADGYGVDVKMDYTYVGYGEYQISMYCPDPALYRGDSDGTLGSEWNSATIRKTNDVGYKSSWKSSVTHTYQYGSTLRTDGTYYATMEQGSEDEPGIFQANHAYAQGDKIVYGPQHIIYEATSAFTSGASFNPSDWTVTTGRGSNRGIVWGTGGRSTPVNYSGDFPYYPQFIVEPGDGEHITNPMFYSVNEDKFFGLGYPETDVAKFIVTSVDAAGGITGVDIVDGGSYETNFSANGIDTKALSYITNIGRVEYGIGATLDLTATENEEGMWVFTSVAVKSRGANYVVGDVITPQIAGATILQLSHGQSCVIDMAEHTAMVNGESVAYYITPGSEWFQLSPLSTNNLIFSSADDTDGRTAKIRWRNGYLGI